MKHDYYKLAVDSKPLSEPAWLDNINHITRYLSGYVEISYVHIEEGGYVIKLPLDTRRGPVKEMFDAIKVPYEFIELDIIHLYFSIMNFIDLFNMLYVSPTDCKNDALVASVRNSVSILNCIPFGFENPLSIEWKKTDPNAFAPEKSRYTDSGYDIRIIKLMKQVGNVYYYDTGITVKAPDGFYFDLVGRSSISKTGWMMANNIGIIDSSYRGNVIIALVKVDPSVSELILPSKIAQLIPRKLYLMDIVEVDELDNTHRQEGGFGSTG